MAKLHVHVRVALDIHNYLLQLTYPGERIPFRELHKLLWSSPSYMIERHEYERLVRSIPLFRRAGWPEIVLPDLRELGGLPKGLGCTGRCAMIVVDMQNLSVALDAAFDGGWLPRCYRYLRGRCNDDAIVQMINERQFLYPMAVLERTLIFS